MRRASVHGDDDSLVRFLSEVLTEVGFRTVGPDEPHPELVLVHVRGPLTLRRLDEIARRTPAGVPILAVLAFNDESLGRAALSAGAHGWYALGTSLARLERQLAALIGPAWNEEQDR